MQVNTLLRRQTNIIKGIPNKSNPRKSNVEKISSLTIDKTIVKSSPESKKKENDINTPVIVIQQSNLKTTTADDQTKTVDLTHAINSLKEGSDYPDMDVDDDDEDSRDNDDLVIDLKDDAAEEVDDSFEDKKKISTVKGK